MRKHLLFATNLSSVALISLALIVPSAHAEEKAAKVDCAPVMSKLSTGKSVAAVAKELKLPMDDVIRCRRHSQHEAFVEAQKAKARKLLGISPAAASPTASGKATPSAAASPASTASPAAK
jgi:hypothetical protein